MLGQSFLAAHFVSSHESHKENPHFSPPIELTLAYTAEIAKSHYGWETKFRCSNCWGAIYRPGDSARGIRIPL